MSAFGESKVIRSGSLDMIKAGGSNGRDSGPTGSSRSYPKGSGDPGTTQDANKRFNPMDCAVTDLYVGGVGGKD